MSTQHKPWRQSAAVLEGLPMINMILQQQSASESLFNHSAMMFSITTTSSAKHNCELRLQDQAPVIAHPSDVIAS
jgi:hypothetical protein